MHAAFRAFLFASALSFASAAHAAPAPVAPILTTPEAKDLRSFARPQTARVTHVDLDLTADFDAKIMRGSAAMDVLATPGASEIVLDTLGLKIARVSDGAGRALSWTLGKDDQELGAPLTVRLNGAKRIVIEYASTPGARALQWLPPSLTAGKQRPYLFSQGQAINNRSWIPTQDSPGIRQTWTARIVVPEGLTAVMSGEKLTPKGEPTPDGKRAFRFRMDNPVPPYLIALGVGDLAFQALGPRTGVYTEPSMMDQAASELVDTEKMVTTAEGLYGPYRWGRYDVLVLPPSFPLGGMENPTLTFLTPTFITGDRANVSLVAHELAHSWSGNLVTNATWPDGWLNEGFTTYFENRIMEALYGAPRARIEADLDWDGMQADIKEEGGPAAETTKLYGQPGGQLEYFKGATFLRTIETIVGRERWDAYLRSYFDRHAFQPQTTAGFLSDLRANLIKGDKGLEAKLELDKWAYAAGLPDNAVHVRSEALALVDAQTAAFAAGGPASSVTASAWTTQEWLRFLNNLPRQLSVAQLDDLDRTFKLSASTNSYVRSAWLELAIANRYAPALPSLEAFLMSVGRGLFIRPLYIGLMRQGDWGQPIARRMFAEAKETYHPTVADGLERLVSGTN
ncbi:MAG: M1 family metallopeptidase [Pseudomonadota bacterium]|uniref:M1 family metallopeptidase n=1 Tax=unclassified Phenylobacterium TaxID=2640670 RepID=UPI0006F9D11B|nr:MULTISPECIES: M1 family metallopeptidase [unclassified Phenylobacterium]KRB52505.1 aminopeptidase [Phenylobacterium sp. Root700]MBT9471837.1 M1 family metallopeptidase [Phenylobacterium sp.]